MAEVLDEGDDAEHEAGLCLGPGQGELAGGAQMERQPRDTSSVGEPTMGRSKSFFNSLAWEREPVEA